MMQFSLNVPNDIVERARRTVIFHVIQLLVYLIIYIVFHAVIVRKLVLSF